MKKERIENDFYPTEQKLTQLMLRHWDLRLECDKRSVPFYPVILEPCNGKGDISRLFPNVVTNDIVSGSDYQLDATLKESWNQFPEIDWVVTNPPFVHAPIILPLAYEKAKSGVISLLRLSYLEPCANRAAWLKKHPPTQLLIVSPRPQYRSDTKGSDSVTSAWFFWEKEKLEGNTKIVFCNDWK